MGPGWLIKAKACRPLTAVLSYPCLPGAFVLGVQFLPTLLTRNGPQDAFVAYDIFQIGNRLAIQPFEFEGLFKRQPYQNALPARINEISPRSVISEVSHFAVPLPRSTARLTRQGGGHRPQPVSPTQRARSSTQIP